jgi:hypothetical protein
VHTNTDAHALTNAVAEPNSVVEPHTIRVSEYHTVDNPQPYSKLDPKLELYTDSLTESQRHRSAHNHGDSNALANVVTNRNTNRFRDVIINADSQHDWKPGPKCHPLRQPEWDFHID